MQLDLEYSRSGWDDYEFDVDKGKSSFLYSTSCVVAMGPQAETLLISPVPTIRGLVLLGNLISLATPSPLDLLWSIMHQLVT